ncbi:MAG: ATP-dependent DNA ligase [Nanobdellota archaeon]
MEFNKLCDYFERLENTSSRLDKIEILKEYIKETKDIIKLTIPILEGKIIPPWSNKKLGVSKKILLKSLETSYGLSRKKIEEEFRKKGDIGLVAESLNNKKTQQTLASFSTKKEISVKNVYKNIETLADIEGKNAVKQKISLISELIADSDSKEAKYIMRIINGDTRIGVSTGTIRDAIAESLFPKILGLRDKKEIEKEIENTIDVNSIEELKDLNTNNYYYIKPKDYQTARNCYNYITNSLQSAYDKINEMKKVANLAIIGGLKEVNKVSLQLMVPFKVMLMQKVKDIKEATESIQLPFYLEYKYDGFRAQVHKKGKKIRIFTRNLEDVTEQFPDVVSDLLSAIKVKNIIIDGEFVGIDDKGNYLPFQEISQRIKRKYDIHDLAKKLPVNYYTWDVLYINDKDTLDMPLKERRKLLEDNIQPMKKIGLSEQIEINSIESGEAFYKKSISMNNEGIVVKDPKAGYRPGNRVGCWLKIKPIMDPLDLVILKAEWGEGKRSSWLTSFTVGCKGKDNDFLEIGKVSTGMKEIENDKGTTFKEMTDLVNNHIKGDINKKVVDVEPAIVISVGYEEIQKSPSNRSGFALRFPRFLTLRPDVNLEDVDDINKIKDYYESQ